MPDLALIRSHLMEEGTIGKSELIKLIKDITILLSMTNSELQFILHTYRE